MFHYVASLPTSFLTYHELTQLEMLLQQIDCNPPLFTASQIFPFGAGILANVCKIADQLRYARLFVFNFHKMDFSLDVLKIIDKIPTVKVNDK